MGWDGGYISTDKAAPSPLTLEIPSACAKNYAQVMMLPGPMAPYCAEQGWSPFALQSSPSCAQGPVLPTMPQGSPGSERLGSEQQSIALMAQETSKSQALILLAASAGGHQYLGCKT